MISSLKPNEVFVFGSNLNGAHSAGRSKNLGKLARKGNIPWNKGMKGFGKTYFLGKHHSEETKELIRQKALLRPKKALPKCTICQITMKTRRGKTGKCKSCIFKGRISPNKGKVTPKEVRLKLSEALRGNKSPQWKGGITSINEVIRKSVEYKIWREEVFTRDNFTCQICNTRGSNIHADHIKPFAYYPKLRFSVDNGRTLCVSCHRNTDTYGNHK